MNKPDFNDASMKREGVMANRDLTVFLTREDAQRLKRDIRYARLEGFSVISFKDKELPLESAEAMDAFLEGFFQGR